MKIIYNFLFALFLVLIIVLSVSAAPSNISPLENKPTIFSKAIILQQEQIEQKLSNIKNFIITGNQMNDNNDGQ